MKLVYIAGKFRGASNWEMAENVRAAERVALQVAELGGMPVVPHSLGMVMYGTLSEDFWLQGTVQLLSRCDGALFLPSWTNSYGSGVEYRFAQANGIETWGIAHLGQPEFAEWLLAPSARNGAA